MGLTGPAFASQIIKPTKSKAEMYKEDSFTTSSGWQCTLLYSPCIEDGRCAYSPFEMKYRCYDSQTNISCYISGEPLQEHSRYEFCWGGMTLAPGNGQRGLNLKPY